MDLFAFCCPWYLRPALHPPSLSHTSMHPLPAALVPPIFLPVYAISHYLSYHSQVLMLPLLLSYYLFISSPSLHVHSRPGGGSYCVFVVYYRSRRCITWFGQSPVFGDTTGMVKIVSTCEDGGKPGHDISRIETRQEQTARGKSGLRMEMTMDALTMVMHCLVETQTYRICVCTYPRIKY